MKYNLRVQEKDNFCVCSSLQSIFRNYGIYFSQDEIANNLTRSDKGFRIDDLKIKKFLSKNFNYEFYWYNETPFNEPLMLLEEMDRHDGIVGIKNHVYLLERFENTKLFLINPENAKIEEIHFLEVMEDMQKSDGFFGLLEYICSN